MASRAEKHLSHAAGLSWIVVAILACDRTEDVQLETIELAKGEYSGLSWGGTQVERFHVVARKGKRNEPGADVIVVSPQHAKPCSLGPVARYRARMPRSGAKLVLGSPSPARLSIFDNLDEHGVGTLSFADIDCERTGLEVADIDASAQFSLYFPDLMQLRIGVFDRERRLIVVDPWDGDARVVANDVRQVWSADDGAWLLEGGELVKRALDGRELARKGENVTELLQLGLGGDLAYLDGGRLLVERLGKVKELATDACRMSTVDAFVPGALSFYSPCAARTLVIARTSGRLLVYEGPVAMYTAQRGQLIVARHRETETALSTVFAHDPANERKWVELPLLREVSGIWPTSGHWLLRGRMPDGTTTLFRLQDRVPAAAPETIADGILAWDQDARGLAWLRAGGELTLTDRDAEGIYLHTMGVRSFDFVFERNATALAYTTETDPGAELGRLRLQFITGDAFTIASDVREYQEIWWPERGILYAQGGDDPGIRFARIDLPCEATSDSPWVCGF